METGFRVLLLTFAALALGGCAAAPVAEPEPTDEELARTGQADIDEGAPRVIEPAVERRQIQTPKIDTENVELGAYFGVLSIEGFGSQPVYGVSGAYHLTEDFFALGEVGRSKAESSPLLADPERRFTYYNLALGYNFLPGEVFLGRGRAMTSALYLTMGVGNTDFAGDDHVTVNLGAGYRVLPADWLAIHLGLKSHLFNSDLLGTDKLTSNLEGSVGLTVFF